MAIDRRIGSKVGKSYRREDASGVRVDPFPYIGIVKNNLDPTYCGRLQVWIPELGGDPDEPQNWRTVSYASPFMGQTNIKKSATTKNQYTDVPHTYGMWMVPPDIGVEVIVLFIGGDPIKGYWVACVNSSISRYMLPAMGSTTNTDITLANSEVKKSLTTGTQYPVTEFNTNDLTKVTNSGFVTNPKPIHEPQFNRLVKQGLDRDDARGTISSSSQRETPSMVFGISTPGRPEVSEDPAQEPKKSIIAQKITTGTLTEDDYAITTRVGGHTFVMDDGDANTGKDQLVRLRTAAGHQIMMHDTKNTFYVSNAEGLVWIELGFDTDRGLLNIYAKDGVNIRTEGAFNLHSDTDININAKNNINFSAGSNYQVESVTTNFITKNAFAVQSGTNSTIKTGGAFNVDSAGAISLKSGSGLSLRGTSITQNTGPGTSLADIKKLKVNQLPETELNTGNNLWEVKPKKLSTIVTVAPTHEPYDRTGKSTASTTKSVVQPGAYAGTQDKTKSNQGTAVTNPATDKELSRQPVAKTAIGNLTIEQTTAYYTQMGKSESGTATRPDAVCQPSGVKLQNGKAGYQAVNQCGFVGKYQMGRDALVDSKLVKSSCKNNADLNNPNNWIGGNGKPASLQEFLDNDAVQEQQMSEYTNRNYNTMVKNGAITKDMSADEVGGMLAVGHLLGPNEGTIERPGALGWRLGRGGRDANNTTGDTYFQNGKYAIGVLGPKVGPTNAG